MNFKSVKTLADVPFNGVELVKVDNAITEVIIAGKLRIRKGESYSPGLQILVQSPGELVKRYRVTATLDGFAPTVEYHETTYDADERVRHFEGIGAKVEKTYLDVLIADSGVVSEGPEAVAQREMDEVPF